MSNSQLIKKIQEGFIQDGRKEIRTGMEVEIHQIIKEWSKERIQKFKWLVIKTAGKSALEKTITVRRKVWAFGIERIFAVHSSSIKMIEIIRQFKVRKKSIKFIRGLTGKAARLKEVQIKKSQKVEVKPEVKKEAPKKAEKVEAPKKTEVKVEKKVEAKPEVKAEIKKEEK